MRHAHCISVGLHAPHAVHSRMMPRARAPRVLAVIGALAERLANRNVERPARHLQVQVVEPLLRLLEGRERRQTEHARLRACSHTHRRAWPLVARARPDCAAAVVSTVCACYVSCACGVRVRIVDFVYIEDSGRIHVAMSREEHVKVTQVHLPN